MSTRIASLTGHERTFAEDELIVTKTDAKGRLTYVNDVCIDVCGYSEAEMIGQQHSIVRHPEMPRCVFKLLWERIQAGKEIFAYVNNRAKNGDHYWVFAHITPNFAPDGTILGYHSNRRVPKREALEKIKPVYAQLVREEERHENRKAGMDSAYRMLLDILEKQGKTYDEFVLGL